MEYLFLGIAIAGEFVGTTLLKYSNGFTKLIPSIGSLTAFVLCFYFLSKSLQNINLSINLCHMGSSRNHCYNIDFNRYL